MTLGCVLYWMITIILFFFKQKTAYEMRISDWSSDVCSSDLDILGIRDDADRDDRVAEFGRFGLAVLGLDLRGDAGGGRLQFLDAGAGEDRHALFLERLLAEGRDISILDGDEPGEHFDDGTRKSVV